MLAAQKLLYEACNNSKMRGHMTGMPSYPVDLPSIQGFARVGTNVRNLNKTVS